MASRVRRTIVTSAGREGVEVRYRPRDRTIILSGWYDGMVGIPAHTSTLAQFLAHLGITVADCQRALRATEGDDGDEGGNDGRG